MKPGKKSSRAQNMRKIHTSFGNVAPTISQPRTFLPMFNDSNPPPIPVDQFSPYLARKLSVRQNDPSKRIRAELPTNYVFTPSNTSANLPTNDSSTFLTSGKIQFNQCQCDTVKESIDQIFDNIASQSCEQPLNKLTEDNLKPFFQAENVFFFHDIDSVSTLYCPTASIAVPHGSGLIGYAHFARKLLNITCASDHVSFDKMYDSKTCLFNSHVLIFPFFDFQLHVKAVIQVTRSASMPIFSDSDEKAAEYLQNKFKVYSRWLFQPIISEQMISDLVHADRIGVFIDIITKKLEKIFNCITAEVWQYTPGETEMHMYVPGKSNPLPVPIGESGVVGYALASKSAISLSSVNVHSAFNPNIDGSGDHSLLILPIKEPDSIRIFGIALRGKRLPHFFTDVDEKTLVKIAPIVIASLNASQVVEHSYQSLEDSEKAQNRLKTLLDVAEQLSGQLHIEELIPNIMNQACDLVKADRCSLFMVNETKERLVSYFHGGLANAIEIPIGAGIVGFTATTGQVLNIKDAYEDPRFNRATDLKTGYLTKNLLCVPIFDEKNEIRGVTEMINKLDGVFTQEDEKIIQMFNIFCGISIENARLYKASIELSMQLRSVLEISQHIAQSNQIKKLIEDILRNSRKVIGAGRAMIFLVNSSTNKIEVYAQDEDPDAKVRRQTRQQEQEATGKLGVKRALIHKMMEGGELTSDDTINREDNERLQIVTNVIQTQVPVIENKPDLSDESMIVAPVYDNKQRIMGALLMQWKRRETAFIAEDLKLLESFSVFVSISLERGRMKAAFTVGEMGVDLREKFSDEERTETFTPERYLLTQAEHEQFLSPDFQANSYCDYDRFRLLFAFFDILGIRDAFQIPNEIIFNFIYSLQQTYNKLKWHNFAHATETTQFVVHTLITCKMLDVFSPLEKLALLVAALAHDIGNDGYACEYNENVLMPLRHLFNNKSVIESGHCILLINIIGKRRSNIFATLSKDEHEFVWKTVIELILATDMERHFRMLNKIQSVKETWRSSDEGRTYILKLILKCSDFCPLVKKFDIADQFHSIIAHEFYLYGDLTYCKNIVYQDFENKEVDEGKSEPGFMVSVVAPMFKKAAQILPEFEGRFVQLKKNLTQWNIGLE